MLKGPDLRPDRHAAEDGGGREVGGCAVGRERLVDLERELTRRHEDEAARFARAGRTPAADEEAINHRQTKRGRLAGAGLGTGQHVAAVENQRNRLDLHGCGPCIAQTPERGTEGR